MQGGDRAVPPDHPPQAPELRFAAPAPARPSDRRAGGNHHTEHPARVDYADAFVLSTQKHPDWTAETWARAVLEGAPAATRAELTAGWAALGLPATNSSASVLGWVIRHRTSERVLLGRDSRIGMPGELLFERRADGLLFATFVHHRTPATRAVWAAVRRTHVRTVLELLDRAADDVADVTLSAGNQ